MAFYAHEISANTPPKGKYEEGDYGFTIVWRLFANDGDDGPNAAIAYVQAKIARRRDPYLLDAVSYASSSSSSSIAPGTDSNARSLLQSITVDREKGSAEPWVWLATLTYEEPEGSGEDEDPEGNNSEDPTDFSAEVDIQTVQYAKPAAKAVYKSGFSGVAHTKVNDATRRPIVNSALAVYDPPPEVDDHRWVIRIKKNVLSLDCDSVKCNVVNDRSCVIAYRGISKTIPQYAGKTRDISAVPVKHPVIGWYVQVQLFIDVDEQNDFRLEMLDRGFSARAMDGDPDGHGGTISLGTSEFITDIAPQRRLTDGDGVPCSEPQLLNGDGQPLLDFTKKSGVMTPVYSVWAHYTEGNFGAWPILSDLISVVGSP